MALGPPVIEVSDPGTCEETTFESTHDQLKLYMKRWTPSKVSASPPQAPRACIVFLHGFIEHYGRYNNIFKLFAQAKIQLTAFDQRGFGLTWTKHVNPKKAHGNTTWKQQFEDVEDLIRLERTRLDDTFGKDKVPIFLMGHSMGGGIAYAFFTRPQGQGVPSTETKAMIKGVICTSPWITLTNPPPALLVKTLVFTLRYFPNCPYYAIVNPKEISHDEEVQKWTGSDPLVDGHVYLKCLPGPLLGGPKLLEEDYKNWQENKPLLILHGEDDAVTNCPASRKLVEKTNASDKEHKSWPGQFHELWHEKGDVKIEFVNYIINWVETRTNQSESLTAPAST